MLRQENVSLKDELLESTNKIQLFNKEKLKYRK